MRIKILLINPPYTNFEGMKESGGHSMPLNLGYLASYLRDKMDCEIKICDAEVMGMDYKQIREIIKNFYPDILGITCPTPTMRHVFRIAEITKKEINPKCVVVVGGIHPTVMPRETIKDPNIDFVVIGEGEITFHELIKSIINNDNNFQNIDGLCFKKNEDIIVTKTRQLIANLDEIPFPARDLFDLRRYYSAPTKKVSSELAGPILTSRGCAFNCIHCISRSIWGRMVRFRSVENVIGEFEQCITKYGIKEFNIYDDTFTLNNERAMKICDEIIKRKWKIWWIAFSRVNTITEELAAKMKKAGCRKISFGLESGSQKILDIMRKSATLDMARRAVDIVRKQGIRVHASFMLGNVGETKETIRETVNFAKSLDLDNATFFITSPFPGTELYEIAKKEGFITLQTKWEEFAPLTNASPILIQKNLSKEELVWWQKKAFKEFYFRPKYILSKFRQMKEMNPIDFVKMLFEGSRVFMRILKKQ